MCWSGYRDIQACHVLYTSGHFGRLLPFFSVDLRTGRKFALIYLCTYQVVTYSDIKFFLYICTRVKAVALSKGPHPNHRMSCHDYSDMITNVIFNILVHV